MSEFVASTITFVITTRNRANYLERTLANVREYIMPKDELIVIDGNSTDDTKEVVGRNADIISVFVSEPDVSEAHAFNKGLMRASRIYIKPVTDDDYIDPQAMVVLRKTIDAYPGIDAIQCGGSNWRVGEGVTLYCGDRGLPTDIAPTPSNIFYHAHAGQGLIFRRDLALRIGGVNSRYKSVDADLFVKLIENGCTVRYLDIQLFKWYMYPHSTSTVMDDKQKRREFFSFYIRLNDWARALHYPAGKAELLEFIGANDSNFDQALSEILFVLVPYSSGRLRGLTLLLVRLIRFILSGIRAAASLVGMGAKDSKVTAKGCSERNRQWSGQLR